jgi:hypothetical protein
MITNIKTPSQIRHPFDVPLLEEAEVDFVDDF